MNLLPRPVILSVWFALFAILICNGAAAQSRAEESPNLPAPNMLRSEASGGFLLPNQCMISDNTDYKLCFMLDGNILLYDQGNYIIWASQTAVPKPALLNLNKNGQLAALDQSAEAFWETLSPTVAEEGPFDAILQNDGNLVITRRKDKKVVWSLKPVLSPVCPKDCPPNPFRTFQDRLHSNAETAMGRRLLPAECLVSSNNKYSFCFEGDGNIVLYAEDRKPLWQSNSGGLPVQTVGKLFLDNEDGQLVAQNTKGTNDFWLSISNEDAIQSGDPFTAIMKDDGNFVITRGDGKPIWSTNTTVIDEPSSPSPPSPKPSTSPSPQPSPSPSPRPEPPPPKGMSIGMIVGIVAGVVLGLAALGVGIFFLMKHRRSSRAQSSSQPSGHKAVGQVAPVKADVEMGGADQMGGTPGKVALAK